jgi:hypothetical protein
VLKDFWIQDYPPYIEFISVDHHLWPSFTGPSIHFVCCMHVRWVCGLVLLCLIVLLLLLGCLASKLWLQGSLGPLAVVSNRFVFALEGRAFPRPSLLLMLPFCPLWLLSWVDIWSMEEFCYLTCDDGDGFAKFFHWPNESVVNYCMVWSVKFESYLFHQLATTSLYIASEQAWWMVFKGYQVLMFH